MRGVCRSIFVLLTVAWLLGCSSHEKTIVHTGKEISSDQKQALLRKKVAALLEKKSYRRAVEVMSGGHQPGIPAAGMGKEYISAINGLIAAGEEALARGDYAAAGHSFKWAAEDYPAESSLRQRIKWDPKQLKKQLDICSNRLMEQGLMEYRRGNLEKAIQKWKEIVAFDPGNMEAKKSLETAEAQLKALQKMDKHH